MVAFLTREDADAWAASEARRPDVDITTIGKDGRPETLVLSTFDAVCADVPKPEGDGENGR